jgi:hypothetical protein
MLTFFDSAKFNLDANIVNTEFALEFELAAFKNFDAGLG